MVRTLLPKTLLLRSLLTRTSTRHLTRHPWQTWLAILGIALGVAVVVAVDLANVSAKRSFDLSLEMVTGKSTHAILGGVQGIPESFYSQLRTQHGIRHIAPVVSGQLLISDRSYSLLGVDPFAEQQFRASAINLSAQTGRTLLLIPNSIAMSQATADILQLRVGDRVEARQGNQIHSVQISRLIPLSHPLAAQGLVVADIAVAQELLNRIGFLDRIDLIAHSDEELTRIKALLPPTLEIVESGSRNQAITQMTRAFHTNLSAMSLLALLVGGFLIYNTMTFMVLQRRATLGTLRTLGTTRRQLFVLVLTEAAMLGLVGALLGLVLGILLGQGLVQLVTRTINDLYYSLEVTRFIIYPGSLLKGFCLGLLASLLAATLPAWEAARSQPASVQQHSSLQLRVQRYLPLLTGCGLALIALGLGLAYGSNTSLFVGFLALALTILGFSLIVPLLVKLLALGVQKSLATDRTGPIARIAMRGISASLSRVGLAVAALSIAIATTIGVGVMIESFRGSVADWLDQSLNSDIYISSAGRASNRTDAGIPQGLTQAIEQHPGVASVWLNRATKVESQWGPMRLMAVSDNPANTRGFNLKAGKPDQVRADFFAGKGVLISEPLAFHRKLAVNDQIELSTHSGKELFSILGVFYDYTSSHGLILMPLSLYQERWQDGAISALGVYRKISIDSQQLADQIRQLSSRYGIAENTALTAQHSLRITANQEIKEISLAIFDRTFTITHVLRLLSILVAFIGILSALMALQLERSREFALLRATGATPNEVKRIIYLQTGAMGIYAGILAIPLGYLMSRLLIDVINLRSFGWSMQHQLSVTVLLEGVALALVASLLAGIYPARHAARLSIAQSLREE